MKKMVRILVILLIFILIISPLFIRVRIECKTQFGECPSELNLQISTALLTNKYPNNKSLFQAKGQVTKILKNNFLVSNFSMQLKLPNILLVNIIMKRPEYSIYDKSQNKYIVIDNLGIVLALSDNSNLPNIIKDSINIKSGEKISEADLFALKLIQGINQMYQIRTGTIQNDTLVVDIPGGIRVILPLEGDIQVLLGSLRLIYTKITTNYAGIYSQIDLRFKNPILR